MQGVPTLLLHGEIPSYNGNLDYYTQRHIFVLFLIFFLRHWNFLSIKDVFCLIFTHSVFKKHNHMTILLIKNS
jgi:hypothetical protein